MKRAFLLFLTMALGATLLLAQAKSKSWTGKVGDVMCGKKHTMGGTDKDCTLMCVKGGSKYALIVGQKVYTLEGNTAALQQFAGSKAKVTGALKGDTITVESASAVPAGKAKAKGAKKA